MKFNKLFKSIAVILDFMLRTESIYPFQKGDDIYGYEK